MVPAQVSGRSFASVKRLPAQVSSERSDGLKPCNPPNLKTTLNPTPNPTTHNDKNLRHILNPKPQHPNTH